MHKTKYWRSANKQRVTCTLCPRECTLKNGQRGLCFVRGAEDNEIVLHSYGRSSGFCIDPIEKKPLNHFYPGTSVLSLGTAGCNLACKFCQNWDISKSREMDRLANQASPEQLASVAKQTNCHSIAFTYNDPVIFHEYAIDCAIAAREQGIKTVAVSAGYVCEEPRREFYQHIDAVNIDLKAFSQSFYRHLCGGDLDIVKDTLKYIKHHTDCWLEITTLVIPGENDSPTELEQLCRWVNDELGSDVPLHFTAFHPDYKMRDKQRTSVNTLTTARQIAIEQGIRYPYIGNVSSEQGSTTYCPNCKHAVIHRNAYAIDHYALKGNNCAHCAHPITGRFATQPGHWGNRRVPIRINATPA